MIDYYGYSYLCTVDTTKAHLKYYSYVLTCSRSMHVVRTIHTSCAIKNPSILLLFFRPAAIPSWYNNNMVIPWGGMNSWFYVREAVFSGWWTNPMVCMCMCISITAALVIRPHRHQFVVCGVFLASLKLAKHDLTGQNQAWRSPSYHGRAMVPPAPNATLALAIIFSGETMLLKYLYIILSRSIRPFYSWHDVWMGICGVCLEFTT